MRGTRLNTVLIRRFFLLVTLSLSIFMLPARSVKAAITASRAEFDGFYTIDGQSGEYLSSDALTTDSSGNSYVAGSFTGTVTFISPGGPVHKTAAGSGASFVAKFDSSGNLDWVNVTDVAVDSYSFAKAVAIDSDGNVIVAGAFAGSVTFDGQSGTDTIDNGSNSESTVRTSYLTKYDNSGAYQWTKTVAANGGDRWSVPSKIVTDAAKNIFVAGDYVGPETFDGPSGTDTLDGGNNADAYLTKYSPDGTYGFTYSPDNTNPSDGDTSLSTSVDGKSVAIDSSGNVYLLGDFSQTVTFGEGITITAVSGDAFIAKLSNSGSLSYVKTIVPDGSVDSYVDPADIKISSDGSIYTSGRYSGGIIFDGPGGTHSATNTIPSGYVVKFNSSGNYLWSQQIKPTSNDNDFYADYLTLDNNDNVYLTGIYNGTVKFEAKCNTDNHSSVNDSVFVTGFSSAGNYMFTHDQDTSNADIYDLSSSGVAYDALYSRLLVSGTIGGTVLLDGVGGHFDKTTATNSISDFVSYYRLSDAADEAITCESSGGGGSSGGSKGSTSNSKTKLNKTTYEVNSTNNAASHQDYYANLLNESGYKVDNLKVGDVIHFSVTKNGEVEDHTATVKEIGNDYVILTIASEPFDVHINNGETKSISINQDGVNNLTISLDSISNSTASVTLKSVADASSTTSVPSTSTPTTTSKKTDKSNYLWVIILSLVIVVAAVLALKSKLQKSKKAL